uniref:Uncharacterized protein n=1 Tax=Tanacetum cinerariifolium TaxID=118510 RepID=A0A699HHI4_TANCI|nr:hypothetical protein [Tanacetum cinerariifolium]
MYFVRWNKFSPIKIVQDVNYRKIWDRDVIVVKDNPDVIHDNNSSDFTLSVDLDNMDYTNLSIDVEPTELHTPLDTSTDDDVDFIDDGDDVARDIEIFDVEIHPRLTRGYRLGAKVLHNVLTPSSSVLYLSPSVCSRSNHYTQVFAPAPNHENPSVCSGPSENVGDDDDGGGVDGSNGNGGDGGDYDDAYVNDK